MAVRIGTAPRGLLGALLAKINGQNPPDLGQQVTPVIELLDNYLIERTATISEGETLSAPTATASVDEEDIFPRILWRVLQVSGHVTMDAADQALDSYGTLSIVSPDGTFAHTIATSVWTISATQRDFGLYLPRPFWLPPGWKIRHTHTIAGTVTQDWNIEIRAIVHRIEE